MVLLMLLLLMFLSLRYQYCGFVFWSRDALTAVAYAAITVTNNTAR